MCIALGCKIWSHLLYSNRWLIQSIIDSIVVKWKVKEIYFYITQDEENVKSFLASTDTFQNVITFSFPFFVSQLIMLYNILTYVPT